MNSHASGARIDNVFERAADRVSIEGYLKTQSVKLAKHGNDLRGSCILCNSGTTKFRIMGKHGLRKFRCYGCDAHGDVVDLVAEHRREEPYKVALWLLGEDVPMSAPKPREAKPERDGPSMSDRVALEIWREAQPFEGSLAERYLLGRGILPDVVAAASANLRFHARAKHHWDDRAREWVCAPAMVAQVVVAGPDGKPRPTGGVHCTYLDRATAGKALLKPTKLMWGPQMLDGRPGGAWLIGPIACGDLVAAEGIETALSVASLALRKGVVMRACAALSLGRLQGGVQADDERCIDPVNPTANPDAPAFTWPQPSVPWASVVVAVDRDMKDQRAWVRTGRGKPCHMLLTAEVRARMCGRLAVAAWKAAGADHVRAIAPPPGLDFNDDLRRRLARECDA